ncbi:MAG: T9SS type A sorting domain-containing protein [Bacteroidetes bacterium]|nr:MAG: T9SS type A sorting domain-containing protein [Bacteroidota bacterium]
MKFLLLVYIFFIFFVFHSFAQTDTLVIFLKNSQSEKIAITDIQKIQFENITGVEEHNNVKDNLYVKGNFPNPFQKQTSIEFELASAGNVDVFIYDSRGNQVNKIVCLQCPEGKNILQWNSHDKNNNPVQSGVYYYEVCFNNEIQLKKMILIK